MVTRCKKTREIQLLGLLGPRDPLLTGDLKVISGIRCYYIPLFMSITYRYLCHNLICSKTTAEKMVEVKNRLVESLGLLNNIWDDIGLMGEQKDQRIDLVFMYIK